MDARSPDFGAQQNLEQDRNRPFQVGFVGDGIILGDDILRRLGLDQEGIRFNCSTTSELIRKINQLKQRGLLPPKFIVGVSLPPKLVKDLNAQGVSFVVINEYPKKNLGHLKEPGARNVIIPVEHQDFVNKESREVLVGKLVEAITNLSK